MWTKFGCCLLMVTRCHWNSDWKSCSHREILELYFLNTVYEPRVEVNAMLDQVTLLTAGVRVDVVVGCWFELTLDVDLSWRGRWMLIWVDVVVGCWFELTWWLDVDLSWRWMLIWVDVVIYCCVTSCSPRWDQVSWPFTCNLSQQCITPFRLTQNWRLPTRWYRQHGG